MGIQCENRKIEQLVEISDTLMASLSTSHEKLVDEATQDLDYTSDYESDMQDEDTIFDCITNNTKSQKSFRSQNQRIFY